VVTVDTPVYTSNVILFRGANNNVINTSDTLVDIVDYAKNVCNLPVTIGQIPSSPVSPWSAKFQDNTISQAIQSVLRWHPGAVTWFDYSKSTPTLNITTRADASTYSANINNGKIVDLSITPRGDLQPSAVAVHYRSTNQVNGNSYPRLTTDIFPEGSDFKAQGVVNVSIDLRGSNVQRQYQSVRTTSIPSSSQTANNIGQRVFWRRHFPRLADEPFDEATSFEIENYKVKLATDAPDPVPYDPLTRGGRKLKQSVTVKSYPRELLDGSIDEWMGNGTIRTAQLAISARCKISSSTYNSLDDDSKKLFPSTSGTDRYGNLEITVTGTNAFTKNYSRITNYEQGETAPTGLAEKLYTDLSQLQYEGAMTIVDEEVGNDSIMGKVINVGGGKSAWAGMQAVVQSVSHSYSDGATSVTFGPPEQLAPQDLIELLGYGRELKYTYISSTEDATNQQSEGKTVGAYTSPNSNATWLGGGGGGSDHPWKVTDVSTTVGGVWTPKIRVYGHSLGNYPTEFGGTLYWFSLNVEANTQFVLAQKNIGATLISNEPGSVSEENPNGDSAWELATGSYPIATVFADPIKKQINIGQLAFTRLSYVPGCINGAIGRVIVAV
jgi:hypothetical protein